MLSTFRSISVFLLVSTMLAHHVDAVEIQKRRASEEVLHIPLPQRQEQLQRSPSLPLPLLSDQKPPPTLQVVGAPVMDYFDPRIAETTPDEMRELGVHKEHFSFFNSDYRLKRCCSDSDIMMTNKKCHRRFSRSLDNKSITKNACPLCGYETTTVSELQSHLEVHK